MESFFKLADIDDLMISRFPRSREFVTSSRHAAIVDSQRTCLRVERAQIARHPRSSSLLIRASFYYGEPAALDVESFLHSRTSLRSHERIQASHDGGNPWGLNRARMTPDVVTLRFWYGCGLPQRKLPTLRCFDPHVRVTHIQISLDVAYFHVNACASCGDDGIAINL